LACTSAQAQDRVAAFYSGRTISITIAYPPGGSYDIYSRLAAAHMGKYIPGRPNFIVQNKPGGIGVMRSFSEARPRMARRSASFRDDCNCSADATRDRQMERRRSSTYIGSFANINAVMMVRKALRQPRSRSSQIDVDQRRL
jgi:hypothetical protein